MKRIARSADFQSGLAFVILAALGFWLAGGLRFGTAMRMGPGYLPALVSGILLAMGSATIVSAVLRPGVAAERWYLRPLAAVLLSLFAFAFGIERLGLFVTTALVVAVASLATAQSRLVEVVLVAFCLAAFSTALFVIALGLPIPAWPPGLAL